MSPPGVPAGADHLTRVFIPDVKGRIFKFNPLTAADGPGGGNPDPPPAFRDEGVLQPFGNAVALLDLGAEGDFVYAESGNDNRVRPFPNTTPPFRMFAFNDPGQDADFVTPGTTQFTQDFPSPFRGTVQPATVFNDTGSGRVFFAGTALVDGGATCIFRFDTFLFALGALSGSAVYDFDTDWDRGPGHHPPGNQDLGHPGRRRPDVAERQRRDRAAARPAAAAGRAPGPGRGHAAVREHDADVAGQLGLPAVAAGPVAHPARGGPFSFGGKRPQGYTLREVAYGHPAVPVVRGVRGAEQDHLGVLRAVRRGPRWRTCCRAGGGSDGRRRGAGRAGRRLRGLHLGRRGGRPPGRRLVGDGPPRPGNRIERRSLHGDGALRGAAGGASRPVEDTNLAKGRNLLVQGDAAQALAALAQAVADAPNDPEARYAYAQALWQGADKAAAVREYEAAARLGPRSFKYRSDLARVYGATNRPAEAIVEYEAALAVQPDSPGVLREAATLHLQTGHPERALPLLTRAVALSPESAVLTQDLAHAAEKAGNEAQAVAAYRRVLEINPGAAVSRGLLAEALFRQGKKEDAIALFQEGIVRNPDAAILQRGLGSVLERSGRTQEAVAAYREYARLAPRASDAKQIRDRAARLEQRLAATAGTPPS